MAILPKKTYKLPARVKKENFFSADFKKPCAQKNITLILFTRLVCKDTNDQNYFKQLFDKHPEIIYLTSGFIPSNFYDCAHTNTTVAKKLTQRLVEVKNMNKS